MNVKVFVVLLVVLVVAFVLVVFYGAVRPDATADESRGGVEGGFGGLAPMRVLSFDDVADAECADPGIVGFGVPANGRCEVLLPDRSEIALCAETPVAVTTDGDDYPEQRIDVGDLECDDPDPIPIYDAGTVLTIECLGLAPCAVRVIPPEG
jgi:hypothetical protein